MVRPVAFFLSRFIKPPDDYASVIAFDIRPTPLTDFTNDPRRINDVITLLLRNNPAFSDSNLFDAVKLALVGGTADSVVLENSKTEKMEYGGMVNVNAKRRAIILVATGIDSMSRINYDKVRKIIQNAGIPIYVIGTGEMFLKLYDSQLSPVDSITGFPGRLTLLQAKNTLNTFAKESGGVYYPITFESELPNALNSINSFLRNQYSLAYDAGNGKLDGKKRKLVVKVDINSDGKFDEAEQKLYEVQHRPFYYPPKQETEK
jgi:VWFA-related protein